MAASTLPISVLLPSIFLNNNKQTLVETSPPSKLVLQKTTSTAARARPRNVRTKSGHSPGRCRKWGGGVVARAVSTLPLPHHVLHRGERLLPERERPMVAAGQLQPSVFLLMALAPAGQMSRTSCSRRLRYRQYGTTSDVDLLARLPDLTLGVLNDPLAECCRPTLFERCELILSPSASRLFERHDN